ncbi:hypothetical protein [Streptomyces sp. NPDC051567]|uniref:hypothetical protein n=1 Tax=Streptomyces sp. NPDC051567 TaxID=3365660 RepID=UPI0037A62175
MWPGEQQPPGGEQNPQDPRENPYRQPPGQANPYQRPGQGEGHPGYGHPPQQGHRPAPGPGGSWDLPRTPHARDLPQPPPARPRRGGSPYATRTVALAAGAAVLVTAAATGAFVLTRNGSDRGGAAAGPAAATPVSDPSPASGATGAPAPAASGANPRAGGDVQPVVPGWKPVVNPKYGTVFDVPPEWNVLGSGIFSGIGNENKNDGAPLISFSSPAYLKEDWCGTDADKNGSQDSYALAGTGTKGGQGAKDTAGAAGNEARTWAFARFAQKAPDGTVKVSDAKEYTTASGLKGHVVTATVTGVPRTHGCSSDGKSIAFSFKTADGDFSTWVLYSVAGVKEEVPEETYEKILGSVRLGTG